MADGPVEVFISYSHKDKRLVGQLLDQLAGLQREGLIAAWHDGKIVAGEEWDAEINGALERACLVLLCVSAPFIASKFCWSEELKCAMRRHDEDTARVIPVSLRACDWGNPPFAKLQGLPVGLRPIASWPNRDEAFADVARGIREALGKAVSSKMDQSEGIQLHISSIRAPSDNTALVDLSQDQSQREEAHRQARDDLLARTMDELRIMGISQVQYRQAGSFSDIYEGWLGRRRVAVKILHDSYHLKAINHLLIIAAEDARLLRDSIYLVDIIDHNLEKSPKFIVMELVEWQTCDKKFTRSGDPRTVAEVLAQLAQAQAVAHRRGLPLGPVFKVG